MFFTWRYSVGISVIVSQQDLCLLSHWSYAWIKKPGSTFPFWGLAVPVSQCQTELKHRHTSGFSHILVSTRKGGKKKKHRLGRKLSSKCPTWWFIKGSKTSEYTTLCNKSGKSDHSYVFLEIPPCFLNGWRYMGFDSYKGKFPFGYKNTFKYIRVNSACLSALLLGWNSRFGMFSKFFRKFLKDDKLWVQAQLK